MGHKAREGLYVYFTFFCIVTCAVYKHRPTRSLLTHSVQFSYVALYAGLHSHKTLWTVLKPMRDLRLCLFVWVRVRLLFKATLSRLRVQCSDDAASSGEDNSRRRRKRQTTDSNDDDDDDDDEELQYLDKNLMTQAVRSGTDDIQEVFLSKCLFAFLIILFMQPPAALQTKVVNTSGGSPGVRRKFA